MDKRFTRDSDQKIRSIYKAFTELVNENGYENLTTRHIAKRADISVGTIYHYFSEGKPAIAASLYEKNLLETLDIETFTGYNNDDLRSQITLHLQLHKENQELYRAFDQAIYSHRDIFGCTKRKRDEILSEQLGEQEAHRLQDIMRVYSTVDAVIHRHLFVEPMFESDTELIEYLTIVAQAAYGFPTRNRKLHDTA
ncbi:MAG: TetR/AcrR family transcriptional regulator [Candidatus Bathyarchaeota archaeon]|nr:TetR/AcrR family transcriptional regulator [Candidatus Bathyarchaeota archaeon]